MNIFQYARINQTHSYTYAHTSTYTLTLTPTFVIFLLPHQMDILLKQIYLNNLNNNEMFIKQIQFLINCVTQQGQQGQGQAQQGQLQGQQQQEQQQQERQQEQELHKQNPSSNSNLSSNISSHLSQLNQTAQSPYQLGQIGQQVVISLLQQLFKDVIDQSKTAHVGDILVNHIGHTIMFEVKNKQSISKEDVLKFQEDLQKFDLGVFISLRTSYIQGIGAFEIIDNEIYLTKDFINLETFTLLKSFIEIYLSNKRFQSSIQNQSISCQKENSLQKLPQNKNPLQNLSQNENSLQNETFQNQTIEIQKSQIRKNLQLIFSFKQDLSSLYRLFQQAQAKQKELNQIQDQIQSKIRMYNLNLLEFQNQNNLLYEFQKKELQEYLSRTPRSVLSKVQLVQEYDKLQLQQYTLDQIVEHFGKKQVSEKQVSEKQACEK